MEPIFEFPTECHFIPCNKTTTKIEQFPNLSSYRQMTLKEIDLFLKKLKGQGIGKLFLTGPEPMQRNDLEKIIDLAYKKEIKVDLRTTGLELTTKRLENIKGKVNAVIFDLFGGKKNTNKYFGSGSHEKILANMNACSSLGLNTIVCLNISNENVGQIEKIIKKIPKRIRGIVFSYFVAYKKDVVELQLSQKKFLKEFKKIKKVAENKGFKVISSCKIVFDKNCPKNVYRLCSAGKFKLSVLPNGDVVPCELLKLSPKLIAGNVLNESIENIWKNKTLKMFRAISQESLSGKCSNCKLFNFCPSCRAIPYNLKNQLYGSIEFCKL